MDIIFKILLNDEVTTIPLGLICLFLAHHTHKKVKAKNLELLKKGDITETEWLEKEKSSKVLPIIISICAIIGIIFEILAWLSPGNNQ